MKDILEDILIKPFTDSDRDWGDKFFGTILWLLTLIIIGVMLWIFGWIFDSSFLPTKQKQGIVTNHYYVPAHTVHGFHKVGKILSPYTIYIHDSYEVTIEIDGLTDNVSLKKCYWDKVKIGDNLCCECTNGRLLNTLYIHSFCGGHN